MRVELGDDRIAVVVRDRSSFVPAMVSGLRSGFRVAIPGGSVGWPPLVAALLGCPRRVKVKTLLQLGSKLLELTIAQSQRVVEIDVRGGDPRHGYVAINLAADLEGGQKITAQLLSPWPAIAL